MGRSFADRVPIIDGLRGAAILMVVLYHVYEKTHFVFGFRFFGIALDFHIPIQAGFLGVEVFFFVSGFCLMLPYAQWVCGRKPFQSWQEYVSRRFWKIVPSYYLALGIVAAFYPFDAQPGISRFEDTLLHATFLHSFSAPSFTSLNGNFWSLAIEVQFYALFPAFVWFTIRRPIAAATVGLAISLGFSYYVAVTHLDGQFIWAYNLLSFSSLFIWGAGAAQIHERWIRNGTFSDRIRAELTVASIGAILALLYLFEQLNRSGGGPIAWQWQNAHRPELGLLLFIFTLATAGSMEIWQRIVANPVLVLLSSVSYNMYLWNAVVISLVADRLKLVAMPLIIVTVLSTLAIGVVLTYLFERPLMRNRLQFLFRVPVQLREDADGYGL